MHRTRANDYDPVRDDLRTLKENSTMTRDPQLSPELLTTFAEPGFDPVSVTIADLVTVRMDAHFHVVEVSVKNRGAENAQIEAALREAFNEALRQVTQRNAERLSELMAREEKRPEKNEVTAS
jgi:hypothetical protein